MKAKFVLSCVLGACLWLLAGCDYQIPLTAKPTRKIDDRLLGVWLGGEEGKDAMTVRQFDESTYVISIDDDIYRAYHSDFAGTPFLSVQEMGAKRLYVYLTAAVSADNRELTLRILDTKLVPDETKDRATLQKLIKANLGKPELFRDALVFKRKQ